MFWNLVCFINLDHESSSYSRFIDGSPRQKIQDLDGNLPRPKIKSCSICDPYVLVFREDDSIGLFIDTERGKIRRKDMSPMGDKARDLDNIAWLQLTFSCVELALHSWLFLY